MAGIFLSWSAPDETALNELKRLLVSLQLDIWEYRDGTAPGQKIHDSVLDAIEDSVAIIACFSDATADRPWLQRELDWAYQAYGKDTSRILPVWIGPHQDNKKPALVEELKISTGDLLQPQAKERFVDEVVTAAANLPAPLIVPAALIAMNEQTSKTLFTRLEKDEGLSPELPSLCKLLGMSSWPELLKEWSKRYGPTVDDFAPFSDAQRLIDAVQATVDTANLIRIDEQHRPIFIRWMHAELNGEHGEEVQERARGRWQSARPLLIVDSISTLDPKLLQTIDSLVERWSSILWIPPYTLHTNAVEELLKVSAVQSVRMRDAFRDWPTEPDQQLAFDAPTSLSVRLWLHRTFVTLEDVPPPKKPKISRMRELGGPPSLRRLTNVRRSARSAFAADVDGR